MARGTSITRLIAKRKVHIRLKVNQVRVCNNKVTISVKPEVACSLSGVVICELAIHACVKINAYSSTNYGSIRCILGQHGHDVGWRESWRIIVQVHYFHTYYGCIINDISHVGSTDSNCKFKSCRIFKVKIVSWGVQRSPVSLAHNSKASVIRGHGQEGVDKVIIRGIIVTIHGSQWWGDCKV